MWDDASFREGRTDGGERADDATLLRRYAEERAEAAFAELVRRHLDGVYSAALRRVGGDVHLAEDVAQQVFVALARKAAWLSHHPVLTGWLYLTTRNEAANVVRTERRRKAREQEAQVMQKLLSDDAAEVNWTDWSRLAPVLDELLDQLSERDRTAILLRFVDRRAFGEIGTTLRLTEDAARMRVERALERLRALLERRGIVSSSTALGVVLANNVVAAAPVGLGSTVTTAALATTPAAVGPAVAFLQFMSTSKIVAGGTALVLALAVTSTVREVYAGRAAESLVAAAHRQNEDLADRLHALQQRTEAADRAVTELRNARDQALARQNAAKATPVPAAAPMRGGSAAATQEFMARHPEVQRAALDHWRAQVAAQYGPLFKALGLSPEQIERFKDLAAQGVSGTVTGRNGEMIRYNTGGNRAEAQVQLRAMLGEDGFRRYEEFDAIDTPAWQLTTELAGALFDTAAPLTAAQSEQLLRILIENRVPTGWSRPAYDWGAIIPKAERVLSAAQMAVLASYRASDEFNQASIQAMRRSQPAAQNSGAKPGK